MFSCGDQSTCATTQNPIDAPAKPAAIDPSTAGSASQPNSLVSRYPAPPNQAKNAQSVAKLIGPTPAACGAVTPPTWTCVSHGKWTWASTTLNANDSTLSRKPTT